MTQDNFFVENMSDLLKEKNVSIQELEEKGIIPYLNSLLLIAKYLECGIDDLLF
ncbi:MAG: hypothetical protein IJ301_05825 [Clostridia bacterium]|nr:hypothetical protein [Clostridia bacterium]